MLAAMMATNAMGITIAPTSLATFDTPAMLTQVFQGATNLRWMHSYVFQAYSSHMTHTCQHLALC